VPQCGAKLIVRDFTDPALQLTDEGKCRRCGARDPEYFHGQRATGDRRRPVILSDVA